MALVCGPEVMMRFAASALRDIGLPEETIHLSLERNMKCAVGLCGHCQFAGSFVCKDGAVMRYDKVRRPAGAAGDLTMAAPARKPKLAVWKFASCDGCQLSLLDCEDELLAVAGAIEIAYFPEATRGVVARARTTCRWWKARSPRRTTRSASAHGAAAVAHADHHRRLRHRRRHPGAAQLQATCASSPRPSMRGPTIIDTLATSTPIKAHVNVDFELHGCPINKHQLLEVLAAFLNARKPNIAAAQRLRRVQAARHCLRAGARHPLPRAGHACRLRRDLPGVQPRLLWLLRPDGDAEHACR